MVKRKQEEEADVDSKRSKEDEVTCPEKPLAPMLRLPAELRNRIYYEVLVSDDHSVNPLTIDESNHQQPGLLRTCKQIRAEALELFYEENMIELQITDLKLAPQHNHWIWHCYAYDPYISLTGPHVRSWRNFMEWLECYHAGTTKARPPELEPYDHRFWHTVDACFDVVDSMKECEWGQVAKTLHAIGPMFRHDLVDLR